MECIRVAPAVQPVDGIISLSTLDNRYVADMILLLRAAADWAVVSCLRIFEPGFRALIQTTGVAKVYQCMALCFALEANAPIHSIFEDIKLGYSHLLSQLPLLACRPLQRDPHGRRQDAHSSADAAMRCYFRDFRTSSERQHFPSYHNFKSAGFPIFSGKDSVFLPHDLPQNAVDGDCWSFLQANFFDCGLILCYGTLHVAQDLMSWNAAPSLLAENIASSAAIRAGRLSRNIDPSVHDRSRLSQCFKPFKVSQLPEGHRVVARKDLKTSSPPATPRSSAIWSFDKQSLEQLRSSAASVGAPGSRTSTMGSLTALIWSSVVRAESRLGRPRKPQSRILTAVDVRRRLPSPPRADYIGVCSTMVSIARESGALAAESTRSLHDTASLIGSSLRSPAVPELCETLIGAHNALGPDHVLAREPPDLLFADHSSMSLYGLDFGPQLGRIDCVREPYVGRDPPRGECLILARSGHGVEIMLTLDPAVMHALKHDRTFLRNASLVCEESVNDVPAPPQRQPDASVPLISKL